VPPPAAFAVTLIAAAAPAVTVPLVSAAATSFAVPSV
jgi:hypothetical protein